MRMVKLLATLMMFGAATKASAVQFKVTGDLNNRFMLYTDQAGLYSASETVANATGTAPRQTIADGTVGETWGEIKYRLTMDAATDDGAVRGVYGIELGAVRFGFNSANNPAGPTIAGVGRNAGGNYSGDGVNIETRFAYVDFGIAPKHRFTVGLLPFTVNKYLWSETAMGLQFKGQGGPVAYTLAAVRGVEAFNATLNQQQFRDADNLLARGDLVPTKDVKLGVFGLYQRARPDAVAGTRAHLLKLFSGINYDLYNVGIDGTAKLGPAFVNADLIYQTGNSRIGGGAEVDHSAYFLHGDVGTNFGPARVTYTAWYASGDDADADINNYIATDLDVNDSVVLFEGGYTDDNYFTEAPYFLTFGSLVNKLGVDFKASDKLTVSGALLYLRTAEDVDLGAPGPAGGTSKELGWEVDGAVAYKLNPNLELAVNAGYLLAGDAMDAFEVVRDGEANRNILRTTARARYTF